MKPVSESIAETKYTTLTLSITQELPPTSTLVAKETTTETLLRERTDTELREKNPSTLVVVDKDPRL